MVMLLEERHIQFFFYKKLDPSSLFFSLHAMLHLVHNNSYRLRTNDCVSFVLLQVIVTHAL